ncbi:MAG: glutathione S-transferase family protein [Rhodospirillaceae bacterium]|nr:glutathione S-transferase family protein [Rhodospirillaceae bacterium]
MTAPITLFAWPTPNGQKVAILLEELELPYAIHRIERSDDGTLNPEYERISPDTEASAIVDPEGPDGRPYTVFATGAILTYLAEKTGRLWPQTHPEKYNTLQWLMFQTSAIGPMFLQGHHFRMYAPERFDYAIDHFAGAAERLYGAMDYRLKDSEFLAGDFFSIADIATFPWTRSIDRQGLAMDSFPNVKRWFDTVDARPGIQRGLAALVVEPADDRWRHAGSTRRMGMLP